MARNIIVAWGVWFSQAAEVLSARSPRGAFAQNIFHHLRFEQRALGRQPCVPPVVQLGAVSSDARPSGTDATLNVGVEVRALADSTTKEGTTVVFFFLTVLGFGWKCV